MLLSAPSPRAELRVFSGRACCRARQAPTSDWPLGTLAAEELDRWLSGRWRYRQSGWRSGERRRRRRL